VDILASEYGLARQARFEAMADTPLELPVAIVRDRFTSRQDRFERDRSRIGGYRFT
jgi:hypothetical protein